MGNDVDHSNDHFNGDRPACEEPEEECEEREEQAEGMSETQVRDGYRLVLFGPGEYKIWQRSLSGSSFEDSDAFMYLGEQIIEALPEEAFEPCEE